jgi:radical SAM protein with 4Fe4S-binding SPASM domain
MVFTKMRELAETVGCATLRIYWQGGEVLCLRPDSVQKAIETAARVFSDSGITIEHHLQTNLLLYDTSKWKEVIANFHLGTISSSLDYPNLYRRTPALTEDEYTRAWIERKEAALRDGFSVSIVSLPNPETLKIGAKRFYEFFKDEIGLKNIQINFPFPGEGGLEPLDLDGLSAFMTDLYHVWVESGRELNQSPYKAMEDKLLRNRGTVPCCWGYSCATSLIAIGPGGEVGQCDCWIATFKDYNFGSVYDTADKLLDSEQRQLFLDRPIKLMQHTKCGECRFWKLCSGGCPVRALTFNGDLFTPDHYCPVYYAMFSAILDNAGQEYDLPINQGQEAIYHG